MASRLEFRASSEHTKRTMFVFETILPALIIGGTMIYFSDKIAGFFDTTGSTNIVRGLENPWTFKVLGFLIAIGYPIYQFVQLAILQSING